MKGVDEDDGADEDADEDDNPNDDRSVGDDDDLEFPLPEGWISSRIILPEGKSAPTRSNGEKIPEINRHLFYVKWEFTTKGRWKAVARASTRPHHVARGRVGPLWLPSNPSSGSRLLFFGKKFSKIFSLFGAPEKYFFFHSYFAPVF